MPTLLALTGNPASGKTTLATELSVHYGFERISGSEILKRSIIEIHEHERPALNTRSDFDIYHRQWRKRHGIDAMGTYILSLLELEPEKKLCFENARNEYDVLQLRTAGGIIIALQCSFEVRLARALNRRQDTRLTADIFLREEEAEYNSPDPLGSHVTKIMQQADITLDASQPIEKIMQDLISALTARGMLL